MNITSYSDGWRQDDSPPYSFYLKVKDRRHIGNVNTTRRLMVMQPYAKYGMPLLKQKSKLQTAQTDGRAYEQTE